MSEGFDLVVVDTPPTRHALDFLDAPARLTRFLDNRVFRLLMTPTRAGLRAIGVATQMFLRTISRVVGGAIVADAMAFFEAFEGMEQGFRDRAARVEELLGDGTTAFVVVSSPRREAVDETLFFADRLRQTAGRVEALIVNRMFPSFGPVPAELRAGSGEPGGPGPASSPPWSPTSAGPGASGQPGARPGRARYRRELPGRGGHRVPLPRRRRPGRGGARPRCAGATCSTWTREQGP